MISQQIEGIEKVFRETGDNGNFQLKAFSIPIPGDDNIELNAITLRPANGFERYYYKKQYDKEKVVLHFTIGNIRSDARALTRNRVSVPFLIARDGTIYNLFSSKYWAFHLGRYALGDNTEGSKKSIGIELSNYGPLKRVGDNLETYYSRLPRGGGKYNPPQVYCTINDKHLYHELPEKYRGYKYFASYTDAQYESLIILLRYLTATYNIPREFLDESLRYKATLEAATFKGINSHVNYQSAGKVDIPPAPAFDWGRVIRGVQAKKYGTLTPIEEAEQALEIAKQAAEEAAIEVVDARRAMEMAQDAFEAAKTAFKVAQDEAEVLEQAVVEAEKRLDAVRQGKQIPSSPGNSSDVLGSEQASPETPEDINEEEETD